MEYASFPPQGRQVAGLTPEGRADSMFEMTLLSGLIDLFWWLKR